jgi:hypothetical protein
MKEHGVIEAEKKPQKKWYIDDEKKDSLFHKPN